MKSYQVREKAKVYLTGGWKTFSVMTILYLVLLILFTLIPTFLRLPYIVSILIQLFVSLFFIYGLTSCFWQYAKGSDVRSYDFIIITFKNIKRVFLVIFHIALRLLIPFIGLVASNLLLLGSINGNSIYISAGFGSSPVLITIIILSAILTLVSFYFLLSKGLYYVIANQIAIEFPEQSEITCVNQSKDLMKIKGNRSRFIFLIMSFIGWLIVGIFTLGVAFIWIYPYLQMSFIAFYEMIKNPEEKIKKKKKKKKKK